MQTEAIKNFADFVTRVSNGLNYHQIIVRYESQYNLKKFKITEIPAHSALILFQNIVQKFYKNHKKGQSNTWVENQLRLFLWSIICYMEIYALQLGKLQNKDWGFFSQIFYVKEYSLFQYQAKILLDQQTKASKWTQQQDYLLYSIIINNKTSKWNQIAKSLFINSNKQFLRASKQCRQRWLNHLDPSKTKSEWTLSECLLMFKQVEKRGKKWAIIVRLLKDKRSQHSIKNKYNSIIKKQQRIKPDKNQSQIRQILIKKIDQILETHQFDSTDQYLFGCSLKLLNEQQKRNKELKYRENYMQILPQQIQQYHNKIQSLRRKIINFKCNAVQSYNQMTQNKTQKSILVKESNLGLKLNAGEILRQQIRQIDQIFEQDSFIIDGLNISNPKDGFMMVGEQIDQD